MSKDVIKVTEEIISCSDNGQHPLVYISLENGRGICQYCGQTFIRAESRSESARKAAC
ncbi:MAG: zinc-finger domain-containing protein [Mariprofundaceae bacterium]